MPEEPPNIDSTGERPTRFGDGSQERDAKPEQPAKPGGAPENFRIPSSDGELDTYQADKELSRFVSEGTELPPELVEEQRAVLLKKGDVVADRFEVVKQLGFGGMGAVYHVRDRYTRHDRALKVMLPSLLKNEAARERFRSEVTISQKLSHENIVRVHDLAADQKRKFYYFTMELVEGKTLNRLLRDRGGKLPLSEALDIVRQLCDALEYAHRYTIHRDLKPQNIMIRPDGSIKVLDFGLAKLMSPGRMTRSSMALGTAYYQAPEQSIHLSELDQRADIYSVGVILYQMLTGEIPVGAVQWPSSLVSGLPKSLDTVIMACLNPKAEGRPQSAAALREAVEQAVKKSRPKWVLPVFAIGLIAVLVLSAIAWKLGTVPSERTETGLSPMSSGQSREIPEETDQSPISEDASPTESTPTVPLPSEELAGSSSTAAEASTARRAAVVAQQAAQSAGAEEHAQGLWDEAVKQLKQAEAHDTLEAFDDAISGYETAANAFKEAETEAARIAGEMKVLEGAQQAMAVVKAEADAFDAAQYAKVRYEQAIKAEEEAAAIADDRVAAATAYQKAAQRYQLAVDETKQQGAAIVAAAKKGAEDAKAAAQTGDVKQYAAKELGDADKLMKNAGEAGSDFEKARTAYADAAAKYAEAVKATPERKQAEEQRVAAEKKAEEERQAKAAEAPEPGEPRTFDGIPMVWIPPGEFQMGSSLSAEEVQSKYGNEATNLERWEREHPRHTVRLTRGFWLGQYEVTNRQFEAFAAATGYTTDAEKEGSAYAFSMESGAWEEQKGAYWRKPGWSIEDNQPVVCVSWNDTQAYISWLNEKGSGNYRLPTEAEWEYACRAGTTTEFQWGNEPEDGKGWLNAADQTKLPNGNSWTNSFPFSDGYWNVSPVGKFKPNAWGLYDMHGNVWEWCADWFGDYPSGTVTDPRGPSSGSDRVLRGGCWISIPWNFRSAFRSWRSPGNRFDHLGFRVALPAVQSRL